MLMEEKMKTNKSEGRKERRKEGWKDRGRKGSINENGRN
jgi:hypothetical protein